MGLFSRERGGAVDLFKRRQQLRTFGSEGILPATERQETSGMAWLALGILLGLIWRNGGLPTPRLTIHPEAPLVERGESVRLTCSMDCPGGKVQWEGLDTDLGNVVSNGSHSVLTVAKASVHVDGEKRCAGQCRKRSYQAKVDLRVYAFPDTLQVESLTSGEAARLVCSMSHVYPPGGLTLSWFRGSRRLASAPEEEEEMGGSPEQLFLYRSVLEVPTPAEGTSYTCRATLEVGQQVFSKEKVANVSLRGEATQGPPIVTSTLETVRTTLGLPPDPSTTEISLVATTYGLPHTTTTPTVTSKTDSPGSTVSSRPLSRMVETWSTSPEPETRGDPTTAQDSAGPEVTTRPSPTGDGGLTTVGVHLSREADHCQPIVQLSPSQGTVGASLTISCHLAGCRDGGGVQWAETPLPSSYYRVEEAEGRSTLTVERVGAEHQGVYRCVARTSPKRVATARVVVSDAPVSPDTLISVGTAGSLLGLVVTGYVSHRLCRKRGL
ncbi:mucosal addressin cell adhesion molecule 1 [Anolis carolinensis]|uniref:mucosal addressin cell adhesion molecule 1 n=1 Tax=Anolis carolinensis TaxID=28377 RepID=UPI002F2B5AE2